MAKEGAGTLLAPIPAGRDGALDEVAGVDLLSEVPAVERWLRELGGPIVLGNYVYADGGTNLRLSVAVDELTTRLQAGGDDVALAFLATPTDVFVVPGEAVEQSTRSYDDRPGRSKALGRPLRTLSGGRLLRRQYVAGTDPGINDSLVPQQGPNYALAKRVHRWRATSARARRRAGVDERRAADPHPVGGEEPRAGGGVRGRAPVRGRGVRPVDLQRADGGAAGPRPAHRRRARSTTHPWQDEAYAACHGGLWRAAYAPRSALGLAAVLGYGATRG